MSIYDKVSKLFGLKNEVISEVKVERKTHLSPVMAEPYQNPVWLEYKELKQKAFDMRDERRKLQRRKAELSKQLFDMKNAIGAIPHGDEREAAVLERRALFKVRTDLEDQIDRLSEEASQAEQIAQEFHDENFTK